MKIDFLVKNWYNYFEIFRVENAQKEAEEAMKILEAQGISTENLTPEQMAQKLMENMPAVKK